MGLGKKRGKPKFANFLIILVLLTLILGCNLTKFTIYSASSILEDDAREIVVNTAASVLDDLQNTPKPPRAEENLLPNSAQEYAWQMGERCIDAPGEDACPLDACVAKPDQYSATLELNTELFGKANPDNYSCGANYRFINNSGSDLYVMHQISGHDGTIIPSMIIAKDEIYEEYHFNYYSRHEGKIMYQSLANILVLYDNPHCYWLQNGDPELSKYIVEIMNPCDK